MLYIIDIKIDNKEQWQFFGKVNAKNYRAALDDACELVDDWVRNTSANITEKVDYRVCTPKSARKNFVVEPII